MKKIYLVIAGAFLIFLVIVSMLLSLSNKPTTNTQKNLLSPTTVPLDSSRIVNQPTSQPNNQTTGGDQGLKDLDNLSYQNNKDFNSIDTSLIAPVETDDFKIQFSSQLDKLVVEKKTLEAEQRFNDWAKQNNYSQLIGNAKEVKMVELGQSPHNFNPMLDFFSFFMTFGQGSGPSTSEIISPTPITDNQTQDKNKKLSTNKNNPSTNFEQMQSKVYYAQCGDQGNLPLPNGCTMCNAGCGAASAAMIASSYVDKKYDLKTVVDLYKKNNYLLGCDGSRYSDARSLLQGLGLKTTDYITFNSEKSDTVVPQLRKYLNTGWTFFTLASFCPEGCGHYFWITDIDDQGNIWAYDPAYGRYQIPYNENSRYPYPSYRLAFGVKK